MESPHDEERTELGRLIERKGREEARVEPGGLEPWERTAIVLAGSLLVTWGLVRRSRGGGAIALLGAMLLGRAALPLLTTLARLLR